MISTYISNIEIGKENNKLKVEYYYFRKFVLYNSDINGIDPLDRILEGISLNNL